MNKSTGRRNYDEVNKLVGKWRKSYKAGSCKLSQKLFQCINDNTSGEWIVNKSRLFTPMFEYSFSPGLSMNVGPTLTETMLKCNDDREWWLSRSYMLWFMRLSIIANLDYFDESKGPQRYLLFFKQTFTEKEMRIIDKVFRKWSNGR